MLVLTRLEHLNLMLLLLLVRLRLEQLLVTFSFSFLQRGANSLIARKLRLSPGASQSGARRLIFLRRERLCVQRGLFEDGWLHDSVVRLILLPELHVHVRWLPLLNLIQADVLFRILILTPHFLDCNHCTLGVALIAPSLRKTKLIVDRFLMLFCAGPWHALIDAATVVAEVELGAYLLIRVVLSFLGNV